jgi:YVTN family beta-propeller protein
MLSTRLLAGAGALALFAGFPALAATGAAIIPSGQTVTPTAAPGAVFQTLNPHLPAYPDYTAGQATKTVLSPDGKTLLVLTCGYNRVLDANSKYIPDASNEYVFVFDVSGAAPVQSQVLPIPNTFEGIAFAPDGERFYVSGGRDDDLHSFDRRDGQWIETDAPIKLGHVAGNGLLGNGKKSTAGAGGGVDPANTISPEAAAELIPPAAGDLAVTADGKRVLVANYQNDSISLVETETGAVTELDLRPGRNDRSQSGVAGGEFPLGVALTGTTAYVSSLRDREIVVVDLADKPTIKARIKVAGNPNRLLLDRTGARLFATTDNTDSVVVIDTASNTVQRQIPIAVPQYAGLDTDDGDKRDSAAVKYRGSSPNSLTLSPDEQTLYVTNGGTNSLAVISLADGQVKGLIPVGYYPNSVSVSPDGKMLYVVNGKSPSTANPTYCVELPNNPATGCLKQKKRAGNQYVLQMTKAGFLTLPVPAQPVLDELTSQTLRNLRAGEPLSAKEKQVLAALRRKIKHVIYIVKENRTYDQVLGDLAVGNGDPQLAEFPQATTPNLHRIAGEFVDLDDFYCSGDVSGSGWMWSTAARTIDINEKTVPPQYAGRGFSSDWEGTDRLVNVAQPTLADRQATQPILKVNKDPDLLPGVANEGEPDGPDENEVGQGYLWNAVLRAHGSVRNYGFFLDASRYVDQAAAFHIEIPLLKDPASSKTPVAFPANKDLLNATDPYFRGFDNKFPDFYRYQEWAREFAEFEKNGKLPQLELVRFMHDHVGDTGPARPGFIPALEDINTPELDVADNDYAVGLLVERLAHSRYAKDTLVFVIEDDAQDGPDHVDAHRTTAFVVGPYVKQHKVVSTHYTTVNMIRTMEDLLGAGHLNLHDGNARPMVDIFDLNQAKWNFTAAPAAMLRSATTLPLPPDKTAKPEGNERHAEAQPHGDPAYWGQALAGFDFSTEDLNDAGLFNRVLWAGLMPGRAYPESRSGADLRVDRNVLLQAAAANGS